MEAAPPLLAWDVKSRPAVIPALASFGFPIRRVVRTDFSTASG
jgi:hypothetical protein